MDRPAACSNWYGGDCRISIIPYAYWSGNWQIVSTDYTTYAITYSLNKAANVGYMEAVWVDARSPYEEGTADYDAWYAVIEAEMAAKLPGYKMRKLSYITHNSSCQYQL